MKKLTLVVFLVLCLSVLMIGTSSAQVYSSLWSWCNIVDQDTYYVQGDPYTCYVDGTVTLASADVLHINAGAVAAYKLVVLPGSTFNIEGYLTLGTGTDGTTTNYGTLENQYQGVIMVSGSGSIHNNSIIKNDGVFTNLGTVTNATGTFENTGYFANELNFINQSAATFTNSGDLYNSTIFTNYGYLANSSGSIFNSGSFDNYYGQLDNTGVLINYDNFKNRAELINTGTLINYDTFENTGTLINYDTFENTGTLINDGTFENKGKVFNQQGYISNSGLIKNYRCPGEVGVITAGPANLENVNGGTIEFVVAKACSS